ncbi:hypothetical protein DFR65_101117 [Oceanihabitans sediminis]|uniref:DNA replication protein DnaD n=1 Tax=Oceanihabitans sediminis TaxID=1812012 RepID=A0A368P659_9FLAO|nr:hypothetical protein [Oceanihabitans sediminis]RBP34234.1 hypothetical protein DFR65_101117 [Oceanihabitans sediminis]RCU57923.1 hypothetical protein DU428_00580 [Oceanihabitans sediminis]
MTNSGFIMLLRGIVDWEWYTDLNACKVFFHCLIKVNYSDKKWQGIVVRKGEFITSYERLAVETGLTVSKVRTALSKLELTSALAIETTTSYTKISIPNLNDFVAEVNYGNIDNQSSTQNSIRFDNRLANESQSFNNQIATTNNKNNNIINRKKIFREQVFSFSNFNIKTLESFFNYWSELNSDKTKMRFEKEQFFEIETRLNKWKENERTTISRYNQKTELQTNRKLA